VGHPAREYHRVSHHRLFRDFDRTGRPLLRKLDDTPVRQDPERAAGICAERTQGNQTAFWRSVGPSQNIFVARASLMSLPQPAKKDPVEYRRALLDKSPRAKACSIWPPRSQA